MPDDETLEDIADQSSYRVNNPDKRGIKSKIQMERHQQRWMDDLPLPTLWRLRSICWIINPSRTATSRDRDQSSRFRDRVRGLFVVE